MENKEFVGGQVILSESTTMDEAAQLCSIIFQYMHWEKDVAVWADDTPEWVKKLRESLIEWEDKYMPTR